MKIKYCDKCGQKMMNYRRNIRKGMVFALKKLYSFNRPMKSSELGLPVGINADFSKLRFWGLIYKDLKINRDKWMITKKGIDFLFNDFEVPKYLFIYNNDVQSYSEEFITSLEILSQKQKEINTNTVLEEAEPVEVIRIQREKDIKEIVR